MYHTAKLFSDMGHKVIINGTLVEKPKIKPHYKQLKQILQDNSIDIVEVYCPLEICRQRNIAHGDRYETQLQEQHDIIAKGINYSYKVETD